MFRVQCIMVLVLCLLNPVVKAQDGFGKFGSLGAPKSSSGTGGGGIPGQTQECVKTDDEKFEEEIVNGGCRAQLVTAVQDGIKQAVYAAVPNDTGVPRELIANRTSEVMGDIIDENMSAGNIVDACVIAVQITLITGGAILGGAVGSVAGGAGGGAGAAGGAEGGSAAGAQLGATLGTAGKPIIRKGCLEALKFICRQAGCCKKNNYNIDKVGQSKGN